MFVLDYQWRSWSWGSFYIGEFSNKLHNLPTFQMKSCGYRANELSDIAYNIAWSTYEKFF